MRIIVHDRMCGRIHDGPGAYQETRFACIGILSLPIVPRATFRFVPGGPAEGERIPLSGRSVARAYLTTWGFLFALAMVFAGPALMTELFGRGPELLAAVAGIVVLGFALGFAAMTTLFWMGARPSGAGRGLGWLGSAFALFLIQLVIAAFGVRNVFAAG